MNPSPALQLVTDHFRDAQRKWAQVADELRLLFSRLDDDTFADKKPAMRFILTWMKEIKTFHRGFGKLLNRDKSPAIADDFTAAIAFTLGQFLSGKGLQAMVSSEKTLQKKRGSKRPDISVHDGANRLVAVVECKTTFGWNRKKWKTQCEKREGKLKESHPGCTSYLCVLSKKGWDSTDFEAAAAFRNRRLCLCSRGITGLPIPVADGDILTPIEPMFIEIAKTCGRC